MKMKAVDINCDMGESFGRFKLGMDEEVIRLVSSANVGCGFHGGDPHVMRKTVLMAKAAGVGVGAHPGLPDLLGFGRRKMDVTPEELEDFFTYQIGALKGFCDSEGVSLQHVKAHGVLSGMAEADEGVATAICRAISRVDKDILWLTYAGTRTKEIAESMGLTVAAECYADRAYTSELTLVPRKEPGAVITDLGEIWKRIAQIAFEGTVNTADGEVREISCHSIAVHGDSPGALAMVREIRSALKENGVAVRPLKEIVG